MAILSKEELLSKIDSSFDDKTSDTYVSLLEDISDTMDSFSESENWKVKYEENDRAWREKYTSRFFDSSVTQEQSPTTESIVEEEVVSTDYNDLWEEK